jgi:hypothetical protein
MVANPKILKLQNVNREAKVMETNPKHNIATLKVTILDTKPIIQSQNNPLLRATKPK